MNASAPLLACEELTLGFKGTALIDALNWEVYAGECWAVLGKNGCGKSTLLMALAGLLRAPARVSGRIHWQGQAIETLDLPALAALRAVLPQHADIAPEVDARLLIELAAPQASAINQAMKHWQLDAQLQHQPWASLSGGERQRVLLACVQVQAAPCALLDEPFSAIDWGDLAGACGRVAAWPGATVAVLHDLNLTQQWATHALLLGPAGNWCAGPMAEVFTEEALCKTFQTRIQRVTQGGASAWLVTDA